MDKRIDEFQPKFVDRMPSTLEEGVLYMCEECCVAIHLCACGCGEKVITPLSEKYGWLMTLGSEGISLKPSIGNFSYPCKSHYFIENNKVRWC